MSMWYGTVMAPEQAPPAKRNHNRSATSGKPKEPLTTEQQQQAATLSAAGWSQNKVAKTIGRSRNAVKHYLATPEASAIIRDERQELVELYRDKARACAIAIDDEKIAKSSALQLATASGICLDKSLLLSGQPTSINVVALMEVAEAIRNHRDAESECQHQQAKALLSLPANQV
jgi:predicted transcriptional regulator